MHSTESCTLICGLILNEALYWRTILINEVKEFIFFFYNEETGLIYFNGNISAHCCQNILTTFMCSSHYFAFTSNLAFTPYQ